MEKMKKKMGTLKKKKNGDTSPKMGTLHLFTCFSPCLKNGDSLPIYLFSSWKKIANTMIINHYKLSGNTERKNNL